MLTTRQQRIIQEARALVGTPFVHQGRVPHAGLDCIGVLASVATALALPHQDFTAYKRVPKHSVLSTHLERSGCTPVPRDAMEPGHIVTFWYQIEGVENHVGILAQVEEEERMTIVHALASSGAVVEHDFGSFWRKRLMNVWSLPEGA